MVVWEFFNKPVVDLLRVSVSRIIRLVMDFRLSNPRETEFKSTPPGTGFLPAALTRILIVISFHWSLSKLTFLNVVLNELASFTKYTAVDILVITNKRESLQNALSQYDFPYRAIQFNASVDARKSNKYDLLWEHRRVVAEEYSKGNHTTFVYIEDDTFIPWPTLVSWALDTEVLEPLNLTRSVYRTEIDEDGSLTLMDMMVNHANLLSCKINVTTDPRNPETVTTLNVSSNPLFQIAKQKHQKEKCFSSEFSLSPCVVHESFLQMYNPYQGMWILTRRQLETFMHHDLWEKNNALRKSNTRRPGQKNWEWGFPERSAGINLFVNVPPGFHTNNVVPYERRGDGKYYLSKLGRVHHIRNGYQTGCRAEASLAT